MSTSPPEPSAPLIWELDVSVASQKLDVEAVVPSAPPAPPELLSEPAPAMCPIAGCSSPRAINIRTGKYYSGCCPEHSALADAISAESE